MTKFSVKEIGSETFKSFPLTVIICIILVVLLSFKDIIVPDFLGKLIEKIQNKSNWKDINNGVLIVAVAWFVMWILNLSYDYICATLYPHTEKIARTRMLEAVITYLQESYQDFSHAKLLSQIVQFPEFITEWYLMMFTNWIPDIIFIFSVVCFMFYYHPLLGSINATFVILSMLLFYVFYNKTTEKSIERNAMQIKIQENILDLFTNTFNILTFGTWKKELKRIDEIEGKHITLYHKYYRLSIALKATVDLLIHVFAVLIIIASFYLLRQNKLEMHTLISIMMIVSFLISKVNNLTDTFPNMFFYLGIIRNVENNEILKNNISNKKNIVNLKTDKPLPVTFSDVYFAYPGNKTNVLNGISFTVPAGKIALLKAPVGRGKTTILNILMGFQIPSKGDVKIGDMTLKDTGLSSWRKYVIYLSQHPTLFNRTLYENFTYGNDEVTVEEVFKLMEKTGYDKWVKQFKNGFDKVSNGSDYSGGQKQLIALFRCLLSPKPVILLDEPTASLDKNSREMVYAILNKLKGKSTVILVSHDENIKRVVDLEVQL